MVVITFIILLIMFRYIVPAVRINTWSDIRNTKEGMRPLRKQA